MSVLDRFVLRGVFHEPNISTGKKSLMDVEQFLTLPPFTTIFYQFSYALVVL